MEGAAPLPRRYPGAHFDPAPLPVPPRMVSVWLVSNALPLSVPLSEADCGWLYPDVHEHFRAKCPRPIFPEDPFKYLREHLYEVQVLCPTQCQVAHLREQMGACLQIQFAERTVRMLQRCASKGDCEPFRYVRPSRAPMRGFLRHLARGAAGSLPPDIPRVAASEDVGRSWTNHAHFDPSEVGFNVHHLQ